MVLIIPAIPIVHGVCGAQIAALAHEVHHADGEIYSQDPIDRARLLRKENSKMIQLQFLDSDPWEPQSLSLIRRMREAVDVPIGIALVALPESRSCFEALFEAGIHRLFMPIGTPETLLFDECQAFTTRRVIPTVDLRFDFENKLAEYKARKVERIAVDISPRDTLEIGTIDWDRLAAVAELAKKAGIRLTALHGVRGYPELRRLQDLNPALDSLVLCRALNENRFPCQLIWREMEATFALESNPASNLWTNPLEGKPHI